RRAGANTEQHGGGRQPTVATNLQPVGPADCQRTNGPFGGPVVDGEPRVVEVTNERSPLIPGVFDRLTEEALRRRVASLLVEPVGERREDRPGPRLSPPHHVG